MITYNYRLLLFDNVKVCYVINSINCISIIVYIGLIV